MSRLGNAAQAADELYKALATVVEEFDRQNTKEWDPIRLAHAFDAAKRTLKRWEKGFRA